MPWVRLHGIKDYYPMARLAERFEDIKVTFNMVPSLVEQIDDYSRLGASDLFSELTAKKASGLDFADKVAILDNFFKVNFKRFIENSPRYSELLMKKGVGPLAGAALEKVIGGFSDQDILDLQVLFNLAWLHSISVDDDVNLKDMIEKRSSYTEEDKEYIIMKQAEIISEILPLYRDLQDAGKIEITTTPYYHPILPLLCDTSIAKVSSPGIDLPKKRFSHPEDAAWHIREAIKFHSMQFGRPPRGMWPSEGSVSEEALGIMMSEGISWVATDEDILFNSLSTSGRRRKNIVKPADRRVIYEPYIFKAGAKSIAMIFRDKNLSDMISFSYNSWNQHDAAWDLIKHLNTVANNLRRDADNGLLAIIMDGENAWEYFEDNGRAFFETLYSNIDKQEMIGSSTVSEFLDNSPPKNSIANVFPGSWINHNFNIWIGDEQDNISWEYLEMVRLDLVRFTGEFRKNGSGQSGQALSRAWRELYAAEGSDWNWWYSGAAHRGLDNKFDKLYRTHLGNIYKLLKKPVPDYLKISIA